MSSLPSKPLPSDESSFSPPPARKRPAGFTLVEVWIGLLITVVIAGASVAAFRGRTKQAALQRGRDLASSQLRTMQQYSLAGKMVSVCDVDGDQRICPSDDTCGSTCFPAAPKGGYGVYFKTCSQTNESCPYYLFADLDGDGNYTQTLDPSTNLPIELLSDGVKTFERPLRITQLQAKFSGCPKNDTWASAVFQLYSGSAVLGGTERGCSAYGGSSPRLQETITIGPATFGNSPVQIIVLPGSGGIQEK